MPPKKKGRAGKPREKPAAVSPAVAGVIDKARNKWDIPNPSELDQHGAAAQQNGGPKTIFTKKARQLLSRYVSI